MNRLRSQDPRISCAGTSSLVQLEQTIICHGASVLGAGGNSVAIFCINSGQIEGLEEYEDLYKKTHSRDQKERYIVRLFVDLALPDLSLTY